MTRAAQTFPFQSRAWKLQSARRLYVTHSPGTWTSGVMTFPAAEESLKCGWEFHFVDSDFSWECLQSASPSVWWAGEKSCQALLVPSKSHRSAHSWPLFLFLAAALRVKWWKVSSLELNTNSDRRRRLVHGLNKISALSFSLHRVPNWSFCLFKAQWKVEVWIRPRSRW